MKGFDNLVDSYKIKLMSQLIDVNWFLIVFLEGSKESNFSKILRGFRTFHAQPAPGIPKILD